MTGVFFLNLETSEQQLMFVEIEFSAPECSPLAFVKFTVKAADFHFALGWW